MSYIELHCHSAYSFLDGASHPEELALRAAELGYEADPIARALAGGETGVVGLLVGSLADFWNQELVRAVQRELYAADRSTLVADADGERAPSLIALIL